MISFTKDDFQANETVMGIPNSFMPVVVTKNLRIATPIVLDVISLTVSEARNHIPSSRLPENIPLDNPFSPPFAGNNIISITT